MIKGSISITFVVSMMSSNLAAKMLVEEKWHQPEGHGQGDSHGDFQDQQNARGDGVDVDKEMHAALIRIGRQLITAAVLSARPDKSSLPLVFGWLSIPRDQDGCMSRHHGVILSASRNKSLAQMQELSLICLLLS